jgi:hypothetical protein
MERITPSELAACRLPVKGRIIGRRACQRREKILKVRLTHDDGAQLPRETHDFSLVLGGPIFQLFRRSHLAGDGLELVHRRLLIITLVAWLPLLVLTTLGSSAGNVGRLSFFHDVEVHVRFLIALPVLVAAELLVHSRIRPVVRRFVERRIVLPLDLPRFDKAIESAIRLRNSIPVEVALILFVYTVGLWLWHSRIALDASTWYVMPGGRWHLTPAGFWYAGFGSPRRWARAWPSRRQSL